MVKNLPTIERSTKIRFGKHATDDQAENTIVLNASSTAINAPTSDSIYMSPLRVTNPASTTVIGYNPTTKELYNTNVLTSAIGSGGGGNITLGTGTTGDYVSTITGGNGITSTGATSGETIAHELSVDTKENGGLVIESNQLAVDLSASSITGTLAVGNGGTGATSLTNLITLGSHTTGNYVQSITGGNGITADAASEGGTPTVAIDAKTNGGLVIESNQLAVDLSASSITGTLAVGNGGTGATSLTNLITLGSHTTGNYVQSITGGNGITADAASEGGTPTVAIDAKTNGGLVIESNQLAVDLSASSITGTLAVGNGGTGATSLTNLITLGSHTTGNYVQSITGGNGITADAASEGGTPTVAIDAKTNGGLVIESNQLAVDLSASSITGTLAVGNGGTGATTLTSGKIPYIKADNTFGDSKISYNNATEVTSLSSNLTVTGNLLVQGSATFQHSEIHSVSDPIIEVGNANAIDTIDMGIIMTRPTANVVAGYRGDESEYTIAYTLSDPSSTDIVPTNASTDGYITANIWGNVLCGNVTTSGSLTSTAVNVDGITTSNVVLAGGYVNESTAQYFTVTAVPGIFIIDGVNQPVLTLYRGVTYRFDYSDSSNASHPLRISTTDEGEQYNTGYSSFGTRGSAGAYIQFIVPMEAPDTMYYNCQSHAGMGNTINVISPSLTSSVSPVSSNVFIGNHIGIGTSSPSYPLDITGNMNVTGGLRVNDSAGTSGQVLTSSGGGVMSWGSVGTAQGGTGVTTGLTQLDADNITSGTLAVGNGGTNITSYGSGEILYSSGGSLTKLAIGTSGQVLTVAGGNPSWTTPSSSPWTTSGNDIYYSSGNVGIGGTASSGTKLNITSSNQAGLTIYDSFSAKPYMKLYTGGYDCAMGLDGFTGHFIIRKSYNFSSNDRFNLDLNTGNLGLGIPNPAYKLDVVGDINFTGTLYQNGSAFSGGGSSPWTTSGNDIVYNTGEVIIGSYISHDGAPGDVSRFGFPQGNTFTITTDNTERFRINSVGDVSIGNDTDIGSGHKMTVIDGSTSSDGSYADLVITNQSEHNNARLLLGTPNQLTSSSAFKAAIIADGAGTYSRNDLHFCLENSTDNAANADLNDSKMVIKYSTGNVGIGTTNPGYKLDVSGTGRFTSSVTASSFSGSGSGLTGLSASQISSGTLAVARGGTNISSYTTGDIIYANGTTSLTKLGIGLPGEVLTVAGGNPLWAPASGGGSSVWSLNGTMAYYNNGNVGIGTTNPGYKLDVSGSVRGTSFTGSGSGLTGLSASQISSGTLAVARGGTNISSYTTGDIIYANGTTSLTKLGIGLPGEVLTVAGGSPSWAAASGGGGGGATAGTASVSKNSNQIDVTVSGGPYDYMYNETSYDLYVTPYTFDTLNISTAMTHGQKLVLKLHTSATSNEMQFARGSSLSVNIDGTSHTVFSNFQDHNLHIPYDNNATTERFLILEITKENTNQVTIEARISAADFTKTREFDASWNYNEIWTFNRDSAIHNVAYTSSAFFYGSTFKLRLGYLGVGHSHDFYFTQGDPSNPTFQASRIEFYYNNSSSPWSHASQTNVYTNFDKSVGMTLTYDKEYRIHHEVLRASTGDYPEQILFTVEEMNAASGGGGGGGSYGTGDFDPYITNKQGYQSPWYFYGIEIGSSFSPSNYNFNGTTYNLGGISSFDAIDLAHTLPSSLPFEYEFYFYNFSGGISSSFKVRINGSQKTTYNSFPGSGSSSMSCQFFYRYRVLLKPRDSSYNEWSAEWREYRD
jgi:F0F1-type ATP synthase delta subunit